MCRRVYHRSPEWCDGHGPSKCRPIRPLPAQGRLRLRVSSSHQAPTGVGSVFTRVVSTVGLFVPAVFVFAALLANSFFRTSRGICLKLVAPPLAATRIGHGKTSSANVIRVTPFGSRFSLRVDLAYASYRYGDPSEKYGVLLRSRP